MVDPEKLQYFTMAAWMRGYALGLVDTERHSALIHRLNKAADMMDVVFEEYMKEQEDGDEV